jgi:hypothetical protein
VRTLTLSTPALLHPVTCGALALWAVNDHVLKGWANGAVTGKLSDVAALVVCPVVLFGIFEWCTPALPRRQPALLLAFCCAAIGLLLVGLELWAPVQLAYRHALSSAQYLARGAVALTSGFGPVYAGCARRAVVAAAQAKQPRAVCVQ